jgi:hypothetical protein
MVDRAIPSDERARRRMDAGREARTRRLGLERERYCITDDLNGRGGARAGRVGRIELIASAAFAVAAGAICCLWTGHHSPAPVEIADGWKAPRLDADKAVACVTLGTVSPPIDALDDVELHRLLDVLGHVLCAYEDGRFESFLALRRGDLEQAERNEVIDTTELQKYALELGVPSQALKNDYVGSLATFWNALYERPPVSHFIPESTSIALHDEPFEIAVLPRWSASFDALYEGRLTFRHRLTIPHRVALEELIASAHRLRWFDLRIAFECRDTARRELVARFVWDESNAEWFLQRAATVHLDPHDHEPVTSNLIL